MNKNKISKIIRSLGEDNWMKDAVKNPGKLRKDLGVSEDETIYQAVDPKDVIEYAKKSTSNKRRVVLAITFFKESDRTKSQEEKDFWENVEKDLDD